MKMATTKTKTKKKTILVIYTNCKIRPSYEKRYAFNTSSNVKEGDMIKSPNYNTAMQIVKILDKPFKYFNKESGDLSNTYSNSYHFEIRDLEVIGSESTTDKVIACKIKQ